MLNKIQKDARHSERSLSGAYFSAQYPNQQSQFVAPTVFLHAGSPFSLPSQRKTTLSKFQFDLVARLMTSLSSVFQVIGIAS